MKKAKLLIAMMLISCLASCNGNSNLNSTDSQDKGSTSESSEPKVTSSDASTNNQSEGSSQNSAIDVTMDETKWKEVIQAFAEEKNFSLEQRSNDTIIGAMKQVGTTYYEIFDDNESERIFTIEDSKYYIYSKSSSDEKWSKDITTQERYESKMENSLYLVVGAATAFAQYYAAFECQNDGVYFASEIAIPDSYTLKNIKISFDDEHVSEVECTIDYYDILVTIHDIGTTSITIPSDYNDNTIGNQVSESTWRAIFDKMMAVTPNLTFVSRITTTVKGVEQNYDLLVLVENEFKFATKNDIFYQDEDQFYHFVYEDAQSQWFRSSITEEEFNQSKTELGSAFNMAAMFEFMGINDGYNNFTFNPTTNEYEGTLNMPSTGDIQNFQSTCKVKFDDSLELDTVSIIVEGDNSEGHNKEVITFSNFGKTIIEIPDKFTERSAY